MFPYYRKLLFFLARKAASIIKEIILRDNELEDARWFTRQEIKDCLIKGSLKLPFNISIAFRLVEEWFNEGSLGSLSDLINLIDPSNR